MIENIILSLESIWAHKLRSVLTMIGIVIGIGSIVLIFSIIEGNTENTKKSMLGGENNSLALSYATQDDLDGNYGGGKGQGADYLEPLTLNEIDRMKKLPGVIDATFSYEATSDIMYSNKTVTGKTIGITDNYFDYENYSLVKGRLFNQADYEQKEQVVVIDQDLYKELFPADDGIGKLIEIKELPYKVIGVVKQNGSGNSGMLFANNDSNKAFVNYLNWPKYMQTLNPIPNVKVKTETSDELQESAQRAADYLNETIQKSDYLFGIQNSKDIEKTLDDYAKSQFQLLGGIASIALVVGGIGVMNIMLVSVTERTREIGVKKALGAKREIILSQFLIESMVLTFVGGIIGVMLGIISGKIITQILGYPYFISLISVVGSLLFSIVIGLIFGLLPAMKASKLDPIEALRYE